MQRPLATRKRNSPGTAPTSQQPQQQFNSNSQFQPVQDPSSGFDNNSYGNWDSMNSAANQYTDLSAFDPNVYDTGLNGSPGLDGLPAAQQSSQLVRRNPNQQLVSRGPTTWQDSGGGTGQQGDGVWPQMEDEGDLEQRAIEAKKEAQAKRKQIPPFVQKLSR